MLPFIPLLRHSERPLMLLRREPWSDRPSAIWPVINSGSCPLLPLLTALQPHWPSSSSSDTSGAPTWRPCLSGSSSWDNPFPEVWSFLSTSKHISSQMSWDHEGLCWALYLKEPPNPSWHSLSSCLPHYFQNTPRCLTHCFIYLLFVRFQLHEVRGFGFFVHNCIPCTWNTSASFMNVAEHLFILF